MYQQQLLTEHFGFSPLSFVDDVINSVNNMIYQASMALQEFVENEMEAWVIQNQSQLPKNYDAKVESAKVRVEELFVRKVMRLELCSQDAESRTLLTAKCYLLPFYV